jgi:tRNA threonylcarbamoyladenosine biosynthesis protein TsaE
LAAGKTQFVKFLSEFLEITDIVTSPTFTLVHFYQGGRLPLIHVDAYRLESHAEYLDLTLEDFLENHAIVIEWGDKFRDVLPPALDITLFPEDALQRTVTLSSSIPHWQETISYFFTYNQNTPRCF